MNNELIKKKILITGSKGFIGNNLIRYLKANSNHNIFEFSREDLFEDLEQIINIANNKKIQVILAGMVAPYSHGRKYKKEFDDIYPKLSKKYNLPLIPFLLEGVALNPSLNQKDGIHPNIEGTIKVSETIKKSIINILN